MAYCQHCGEPVADEAVICPKCGVPRKGVSNSTVNDNGSFGWGALGFCIPLVGLILFLMWKDTQPKNAKIAGKGALLSVIVTVVLYVLVFLAAIIAGEM